MSFRATNILSNKMFCDQRDIILPIECFRNFLRIVLFSVLSVKVTYAKQQPSMLITFSPHERKWTSIVIRLHRLLRIQFVSMLCLRPVQPVLLASMPSTSIVVPKPADVSRLVRVLCIDSSSLKYHNDNQQGILKGFFVDLD